MHVCKCCVIINYVQCTCLYVQYKYMLVCMYVCMYVRTFGHLLSQSMDQPGKVANPARGLLNREN